MSEKIKWAAGGGAILMASLLFLFPNVVFESVSGSLEKCMTSLLPSLFPMSVLSKQICPYIRMKKSKTGERIAAITGFSIDTMPIFFIGLLCGYPIASIVAKDLYEKGKITMSEAKKAVVLCNNASPAFLIFFVGKCIFSSQTTGCVLYLCQTIAVTVCARFMKTDRYCNIKSAENFDCESLSSSVARSAKSFVELCGFVIFFSLAGDLTCAVLGNFRVSAAAKTFISGFFEAVSGVSKAARFPYFARLFVVCFFCSFGGLSVWFQIRFCAGDGLFDAKQYVLTRLSVFVLTLFFSSITLFLIQSSLL